MKNGMSIYIPKQLRERMAERPAMNWSFIAQRAFEAALARPQASIQFIQRGP